MKIPIQQLLISLALPLAVCGAGVVNVIPSYQSPETDQNSEPSLAVFTGGQRTKAVVHTFSSLPFEGLPSNSYFTSDDGGASWDAFGTFQDYGCTLDWSPGGTTYAAIRAVYWGGEQIEVLKSSDPTARLNNFSTIPGSSLSFQNGEFWLAPKPWLEVVRVGAADHLYVGMNNHVSAGGHAMIHYSLDGGMNWTDTDLEGAPGASDVLAGVRLAISGDGDRVYALFERDLQAGTKGSVVLVRDDLSGAGGFQALPNYGTTVASSIALPWMTESSWGHVWGQMPASWFDVAVNPLDKNDVYMAYTEVRLKSGPWLQVKHSHDGGATFSLIFSRENASMPALAITKDGTVGLLFAEKRGLNLEIHCFKAFNGNFTIPTGPVVYDPWNRYSVERVLAAFPDTAPIDPFGIGYPLLGDYFTLKAVDNMFYGTFSASGEPDPAHFPCGAFFQRGVKVNGSVQYHSWLTSPGTLVDFSENPVAPSMDPYFFSESTAIRQLVLRAAEGQLSLAWPGLPLNYPQFRLESSPLLGPLATWTPATNGVIVETNGDFVMTFDPTEEQQYFRLNQDVAGGQFQVFTSAGKGGTSSPAGTNGILVKAGYESETFTAMPDDNYAVGNWYIDGVLMQSGNPTLTVSNINVDHTVLVTFVASNDLAVTAGALNDPPQQAFLVGSNFNYVVNVANVGLNPLSGVTMTDLLPDTVSFVSATTSQGSVVNNGGVVEADIGDMSPGASVTVTITVTPEVEEILTNTVDVGCNEFEPDLGNNTAAQLTNILAPVTLTNQPTSRILMGSGAVNKLH